MIEKSRYAQRSFIRNKLFANVQGRKNGRKRGTILRAPNHYRSAESLRGAPDACGGRRKSRQCYKYFLQWNTFAFE